MKTFLSPRLEALNPLAPENREALAAVAVVLLTAVIFAGWFTGRQLAMVAPEMAGTYPWHIRLFTMAELTVVVLCGHFAALALFRAIAPAEPKGRLALLGAAVWVPLLWAVATGSFSTALGLVVMSVAVVCAGLVALRPNTVLTVRFLGHAASFLVIAAIVAAVATVISPFHQQAPLTVYSGFSQGDLHILSPLYKSFVWSKLFSFSDLDYSAWAGVPSVPTSLRSVLVQFLALAFDLPSADVKAFHRLTAGVVYAIVVSGSFGFYLLLRVGMRVRYPIAVAGGILFVLGNAFFHKGFREDYLFFVTSYALLPYALLGLNLAIRRGCFTTAAWTGVVMALPFYVLAPHPEGPMHATFAFACMAAVWLLPVSHGPSFGRRLGLMAVMAGVSLLAAADFLLPLLQVGIQGSAVTFGHQTGVFSAAQPPVRLLNEYLPYLFPVMVLAVPGFVYLWFRRHFSVEFAGALLLAAALLAVLLPGESGPLAAFLRWTELPIYFVTPHRIMMYLFLAVLIIGATGVEGLFEWALYLLRRAVVLLGGGAEISRRLEQYTVLAALVAMVAVVGTLLDPRGDLKSARAADNPDECSYYISLGAQLANFPLLGKDKANVKFVRGRLLDFERQAARPNHPAARHIDTYWRVLRSYEATSVNALSDSEVLTLAARMAPMIDGVNLSAREGACVYPPMVTGRNELVASDIINVMRFKKFVLRFNLDALYGDLPSPFARIVGATGRWTDVNPDSFADPRAGEPPRSVDSHLGLGAGMFVNNATTTLDPRFMMGYPLLHAIYLYPNQHFEKRGRHYQPVPWAFDAREVFEPVARKLFDIAGADIVTVRAEDLDLGLDMAGTRPLSVDMQKAIDPRYVPLVNQRSYGMAYLATDVTEIARDEVDKAAATVRGYFKNRVGADEYGAVVRDMQERLMALDGRRAVLVERDDPKSADPVGLGADVGLGEVRGLAGERALVESDCRRESCVLVFNQAAVPGWRAYVDGDAVPINRANFAFLSIDVPQGPHHVTFLYLPTLEILGILLTLMVLSVLLGRLAYGGAVAPAAKPATKPAMKAVATRPATADAEPAPPTRRPRNYLRAFALTMLIIPLYFAPYFLGDEVMYVSGDGAVSYFTLKWVYAAFLESGEFPVWNFQMLFGQPMEYAYIAIGPSKYLMIFVGALFGIHETWALYHVAVMIDFAIIAAGVFLIARHFDFEPLAAAVGSLALCLTTYWHIEHYFIHHFFVSFPVLIYFAIRFAEKLDFRFLGGAALFMAISFYDGATYMPFMLFYQFMILVVLLAVALGTYHRFGKVDHHIFHWTTIAGLVGALVLSGIWGGMIIDLLSGDLIAYRNGRSLGDKVNVVEFAAQNVLPIEFLTSFFGIHGAPHRPARFLTVGGPVILFFSLYAVALAISGARFRGGRHVLALVGLSVISVLATQGLEYKTAAFYFALPGMWTYRFGLGFYAIPVVAVVVAAMLDLNAFLTGDVKHRLRILAPVPVVLVAASVIAVVYIDITGTYFWNKEAALVQTTALWARRLHAAILLALLAALVFKGVMFSAPRRLRVWLTGSAQRVNFNLFDAYPRLHSALFSRSGNLSGWVGTFVAFSLLLANVGALAMAWRYDTREFFTVGTAREKVIGPTKVLAPLTFPERREDSLYGGIYFIWLPVIPGLPDFAVNARREGEASGDIKEKILGMQTSANTLFVAGEHAYTCVPWLDTVTSTPEIEYFFRRFGGFDDVYMKSLILGATAGQAVNPQYMAGRWIENDPAARRLLGCSSDVVRFGQDVRVFDGVETAAAHLRDTLGQEDVIITPPGVSAPAGPIADRPSGRIVGERYWSNEIRFKVHNDSDAPAWVLVADTGNKRWRAAVNGVDVPIHRANLSFKGVVVPAGDSEVVFKYATPWSTVRIWLVAVLLPLLMAGFFAHWWRLLSGRVEPGEGRWGLYWEELYSRVRSRIRGRMMFGKGR